MDYYFAPMEGITNYIFRNAYHKYYGGINKYFSPFLSPAERCPVTPKEIRDICPDNNKDIYVVPQIITNKSNHFIECAKVLMDMGYTEINYNLGCPSGTVCAKKKGAGFLSETYALDKFLDSIYEYGAKDGMKI